MSTRSTRSSNRNTKRNSSSINNNNQEMIIDVNNITKVTIDPSKDNVSVSSATTPTNDSNRHEISNKRVRTVEGSNDDIVMTEKSSPPESQRHTNEMSTPKIPVAISLSESLHAPKNNEDPLVTAPQENQSGANTKIDLPNKGKNKVTNTNQDTLMHEQLDLSNFKGEQTFKLFCPLNHFPNNDNPHEVLNKVRAHFANKDSFKGCSIDTICKISIIVLTFTSDVDKCALDGTNIGSLKVTFHDFNEENTCNIIQQELSKIFNRSIRFVDIPTSYPTEVFVDIVQNQFGKIHSYKEIIRQKRNNNQQRGPNQRNFKPQQPIYKQLHVVFKEERPVKNFFTNEIYSLKIENWVCCILPADHTHPEHDKRTKFGYKITGLPMNAQLGDLYPILTRINAQTCSFAPTNNKQLQKAAYIYVKEKDYKDQIFRIKCFNTIIYVFPQNIRLSCTICGDPTHEYTNCTNKQDPNQRPKASIIDRNQNKKPTINQQIYNQFKSIIATQNGERIIRMDQNKYQYRQQQPTYNLPPSTHAQNIPDNTTKINRLEQELNALKLQLKTVAEENAILKKELTMVKESITTNTKELLHMKEQLTHVNAKSDIMIQKLDEISLNQNISPLRVNKDNYTSVVSLPTYNGQDISSGPIQYPMEDINSIQGHSELGRLERENDTEYYNQTNENDTYNYEQMENPTNDAGLLSRFTNYIGGNSRHYNHHDNNLHDTPLNYTPTHNIDQSSTHDHTTAQTSNTLKNKTKNFYKNKSSSHIKNRIITPTQYLNVQSPHPINNADDLITLDAINDSQDETFNDYIKIGTINIHAGFNNKLDLIIEYYIYYNYNILIITETGLFENQLHDKIVKIPHPTTSNDHLYIVHDCSGGYKGSGVTAIMDSFFYQHLISNTRTHGRILHLKFGFKQHVFFHILGLYLPASSDIKYASIKQACFNYINKTLLINKPQDHYLILGDFNTTSNKKNQSNTNPINNLIPLLKQFQFKDVVKHFNTSPPITHKVNRIDYIFTSPNLLPHTYHAFTHSINEHQFFHTDHKLVGCLLNKFFFTTTPVKLIYNKLNDTPSPDKIDYHNININTWKEYEQHSNVAFDIPLPILNSQEDLDRTWSDFVDIINDLKSCLPKKNSPQNPYSAPLKLRQAHNKVFKLQRLLQTFNAKRILHVCNILRDKSTVDTLTQQLFLLNIKRSLHNIPFISSFIIPKHITLKNFDTTKSFLKQLLQTLRFNYNTIKNDITKKNIEYFVEARNNNLTENQSKMLYSILNRQPRKITLSKLQYIDENNEPTFTTDPDKIESLTRHHFQLYASPSHRNYYTSPDDLPSPWNDVYLPRQDINDNIWHPLLQPLSMDDLKLVIHDAAKYKAPGPSKITYEDIKHLGQSGHSYLLHIYNYCFNNNCIPSAWKLAYIFPIPKPQDWNSQLSNTRPITLLETPRKLYVSILSKRLNYILANNPNVTTYNNRAGILGQSCLEPLLEIQHSIEIANKLNVPFWLALQDLSKAYDRMNISLLRLALLSIKLPHRITSILCDLFTNCTNQIILQNNNLTSPFSIKQGIHQGEIISLLLWILYYNPLFLYINQQSNLYFQCSFDRICHVLHPESDTPQHFRSTVTAYLDDTSWITNDLDQLNKKLNIANSFYKMADIQVNLDKYKIITNIPKINSITLAVDDQSITLPVTKKTQSERLLGIQINGFNNQAPVIKKLKATVGAMLSTIMRKDITHDHVAYLINKILLPRLEYQMQFTILSYSKTQEIMAPLKKLFKHKFNLSISTPNYVIYNSLFPYINDLFANQIKSQSSILTALFNTPILSPIALHKITYTLKELWLPSFPLSVIPYYNTLVRPTYLTRAIRLLNSYNINVLPNFDLVTLHGRYPIRHYIRDLDAKALKSMSKKRILYMDQLVSLSGYHLLTWEEVKIVNKNNYKGPKPKWFSHIEDNYTLSHHRRLVTPLQDIIVHNYNVTRPKVLQSTRNNNIHHPRSQFIAFWNNNCSKANTDLVLGKTIEQDNTYNTSISLFQHYIPSLLTASQNSNAPRSPNSSHHAIYLCPGCHIREPNYRLGYKYTCLGSIKTSSCNIIKTTPYNYSWTKKFETKHLPKTALLLNKPLHLIRLTSYNDYLNIFSSTPTLHHSSINTNIPISDALSFFSSSFHFDFSFISKCLLISPFYINQFKNSLITFDSYRSFNFFTDGSLSHIGTPECRYGFGWIQVAPNTPRLQFQGCSCFSPSSTRAEIFSILTVLLSIPSHSSCVINTDSQNCITTFYNFINEHRMLSIRQQLKINNYDLWYTIRELVFQKHLIVTFVKVKAHDGIVENDIADNLAKAGALGNDPILINPRFISNQLATIIWNGMAPIVSNVRKFCNTPTAAAEFTRLMNCSAYAPITNSITANLIDWDLMSKWIKHNPLDSPTSRKLAAIQAYKVKSATLQLPTLDKRQLFYPALYLKLTLLCPTCGQEPDSNDHIGQCVHSVNALFNILLKHYTTLINALKSLPSDFLIDDNFIHHITLHNFFPQPDSIPAAFITDVHKLLIYNFFPKLLTTLISHLIPRHTHVRNKIMLDLFSAIQQDIHDDIWNTHARNFHDFEKSILNINKKDKKNYRSTFCSPKKKRSSLLHKRTHGVAFPITQNNNDVPDLASIPSRTPVNSRQSSFDPFNEIENFNPLARFNQDAFIRYTSCNFLHSGSWQLHRARSDVF
ncbi:ribonuclease H-like domain-containing protein [Rhizophagus clarus]|uniref:Ribonuclease H-like domain-containing protein n=1 Tax=Rhizophagus clarus TaxID=94130 RepID=A0A8H3LRM4_9GLOM|nr:ribonuclease H-like domain-containing protein [Rhizophagus clarus]